MITPQTESRTARAVVAVPLAGMVSAYAVGSNGIWQADLAAWLFQGFFCAGAVFLTLLAAWASAEVLRLLDEREWDEWAWQQGRRVRDSRRVIEWRWAFDGERATYEQRTPLKHLNPLCLFVSFAMLFVLMTGEAFALRSGWARWLAAAGVVYLAGVAFVGTEHVLDLRQSLERGRGLRLEHLAKARAEFQVSKTKDDEPLTRDEKTNAT